MKEAQLEELLYIIVSGLICTDECKEKYKTNHETATQMEL